jgi:hypothetical protein
MEHNVDALHFPGEFVTIPHISKKKGCLMVVCEQLLEKKKFTFIVVEGHKLFDGMLFEQLMDKLSTDRPACSGDQNPLTFQCHNGLLPDISGILAIGFLLDVIRAWFPSGHP